MVTNQLIWGKSQYRLIVRFCRMLEGDRAKRHEVLDTVIQRLLSIAEYTCDTSDGVEIVLSPNATNTQIRSTVEQLVALLRGLNLLSGDVRDTRFGTWRS